MATTNRIKSIDLMRGFTLFLMLFVNDLYVEGVPKWLVHTKAEEDGMGLADWVFPGFLFMVGLSIPFAFQARTQHNDTKAEVLLHIIVRTISLLLIGVLMVNMESYNEESSLLPLNIWAIGVFISIFLIWNKYNEEESQQTKILKYTGIIGLLVMVSLFRGGTTTSPEWLTTSWWGILGLIGWGYFVAALSYLWLGEKLFATIFIWFGFLSLNVLSLSGHTQFLDPVKPIFGVILDGNVPAIVLAGLVVSILLRKYSHQKFLTYLIPGATICLLLGFIFRRWFILSKIIATPSWALVCTGISMLVFALFYYVFDTKSVKIKANNLFEQAGKNSLTTYLFPDIIYHLLWVLPINLFIYKQNGNALFSVAGSLFWAFLMLYINTLLTKIPIKLKL